MDMTKTELRKLIVESLKEEFTDAITTGDACRVDMVAIKAHDNSPQYLKAVTDVISSGKGSVYVSSVENGMAHVKSTKEGADTGVIMPLEALSKIIDDGEYSHSPEMRVRSDEPQNDMNESGKSNIYTYHINLNERGSFIADVRNAKGKTVYEIKAGDELGEDETSIFDDGYMKNIHDIGGLEEYLKEMQVIPNDAKIINGSNKNMNEALTPKSIAVIEKWMGQLKDNRKVAEKIIDTILTKQIGLSSSDLPDTATFMNGLDAIEDALAAGDFNGAFNIAKETAKEMLNDEGMSDMDENYDADDRERQQYDRQINKYNKSNKQRYECPTCKTPNALSAWEKQKGYQCNACANAEEGLYENKSGKITMTQFKNLVRECLSETSDKTWGDRKKRWDDFKKKNKCTHCNGIKLTKPCKVCGGKGYIKENETSPMDELYVEYVKEMPSEQPFTMKFQGQPSKFEYCYGKYGDKIDIAVYSYRGDVCYGYSAFRKMMGIKNESVKEKTPTYKTFNQIKNEQDPTGKNHDLRLTCVKCGTSETCKCSKPKRKFEGICYKCSGTDLKGNKI